MSTTTENFTSPIYRDNPEPETESNPALDQDATATDIDLNDPALLMQDATGGDPTLSAYAAPPPPPTGFYRVKLKRLDVKDKKTSQLVAFNLYPEKNKGVIVLLPNGNPKMYFAMAVEHKILGGQFDNVTVYDRFLKSQVDRHGRCPVLNLLHGLKVQIPKTYNMKTLIDLVTKALASEPEVDAELDWSASLSQDDQERIEKAQMINKDIKKPFDIQGMHRFPQVDGKFLPHIEKEIADFGKVTMNAQAKVIGYFPASSKTGGGTRKV